MQRYNPQKIEKKWQKKWYDSTLFKAENPLKAAALLNDYKIDLMFLDINMPKMNGVEFLQALRADPTLTSTLVFVLTSSDNDKDKMAAYNLNVAGYILKPLRLSDFVQTVATLNLYWALLEFPNSSPSRTH